MCGIAGIFVYKNNAPPVQQEELLRIRDAMSLRGPDGDGAWIRKDEDVGLGHRRLSIIDLSEAGAQPMSTVDGRFCIVFNGEIYNYQELRAGLENRGYRFRSGSDTEVLLNLYADKGPDMVKELRGMFAFALWDEENQGLFLARDPFGVKPLYYADDGQTIRVASQVKALLAGGGISTTPEPAGHVGFFLWGHVPEPFTLYKQIRSLSAGSTLWISKTGQRNFNNYFNITDELARINENGFRVEDKGASELMRDALADSIRYHLVADVPVSVFLSSGLDSTTLTAIASESTQNLLTVTLGFNEYRGTENDEVPLAELTAQTYETTHKTYWVSAEDFQTHYDNLLKAMDQPSVDGVNSYFVSFAAARNGIKVALSGLGGDELFGGYSTFTRIPKLVQMVKPISLIPGLGSAFRWVSMPWLKKFTSPKYAGLFEYGNSYSGAYLLNRSLFMPWELPDILDTDLVKEGWRDLQPLSCLKETIHGVKGCRARITTLEMSWYMRNQLLRDADWAGMAHSLEIRVPLVDIKLLQSATPFLAKNRMPTKLDMALTLTKPLPKEVVYKPKTGFSIPVYEWLNKIDTVSPYERGLRGWAKTLYKAQTKVAV